MATVVYTKPPQDGSVGTLFAGYAFWVSANVPQRNRFKELIQVSLSSSGIFYNQDFELTI